VRQPSHPSYNIGIYGDKLKQKTKKLNVLTGNLSCRITGRLKRQAVESQFLAKNQKAKPCNHCRKDGARQNSGREKAVFKIFFENRLTGRVGALAITANPPPATAPAKTAYLKLSVNHCIDKT
jgi:hypothetical protein